MTRRERLERRADRLREWAGKRRQKSTRSFAAAQRIADGIPLGQPILVRHHSERHHRRDLARIDNGMRAGVEHKQMAQSMDSRANTIEGQLERAIYSDDADAIEKLKARIAELEAARDRIKTVNRLVRTQGLQAALPELTDAEKKELLTLMRITPFHHVEKRGFPAYVLTNLGGNINRQKKRLTELAGDGAGTTQAVIHDAETATARAGLTITQEMTTPRRPGKTPRPVWVVRGNVAFWRPLLTHLEGRWYRGAFSFWDDPTDAIEQACAAAEAEAATRPIDPQR